MTNRISNYIAYNTIRMYDDQFARPENAVSDLWAAIVGVIPHYQRQFGIDGVMVDMGHALPATLKQRVVQAPGTSTRISRSGTRISLSRRRVSTKGITRFWATWYLIFTRLRSCAIC